MLIKGRFFFDVPCLGTQNQVHSCIESPGHDLRKDESAGAGKKAGGRVQTSLAMIAISLVWGKLYNCAIVPVDDYRPLCASYD
jgi:hypothetical protein